MLADVVGPKLELTTVSDEAAEHPKRLGHGVRAMFGCRDKGVWVRGPHECFRHAPARCPRAHRCRMH